MLYVSKYMLYTYIYRERDRKKENFKERLLHLKKYILCSIQFYFLFIIVYIKLC